MADFFKSQGICYCFLAGGKIYLPQRILGLGGTCLIPECGSCSGIGKKSFSTILTQNGGKIMNNTNNFCPEWERLRAATISPEAEHWTAIIEGETMVHAIILKHRRRKSRILGRKECLTKMENKTKQPNRRPQKQNKNKQAGRYQLVNWKGNIVVRPKSCRKKHRSMYTGESGRVIKKTIEKTAYCRITAVQSKLL